MKLVLDTIGKSGLPEQIVSDSKPILAGPVTVNLVKNGRIRVAKGKTAVRPAKKSDTTVE